jgi:hypothetical protein
MGLLNISVTIKTFQQTAFGKKNLIEKLRPELTLMFNDKSNRDRTTGR